MPRPPAEVGMYCVPMPGPCTTKMRPLPECMCRQGAADITMHGADAGRSLVGVRAGLSACLHEVVLCVGALPGAGSSFHPESALPTSTRHRRVRADGYVSYLRMAGVRARNKEWVPQACYMAAIQRMEACTVGDPFSAGSGCRQASTGMLPSHIG